MGFKIKIDVEIEVEMLHGEERLDFKDLENVLKKKLVGYRQVSTVPGNSYKIIKIGEL